MRENVLKRTKNKQYILFIFSVKFGLKKNVFGGIILLIIIRAESYNRHRLTKAVFPNAHAYIRVYVKIGRAHV